MQRERLAPPPDWMSGRHRLAIVTGPAGYGKTTLLSDWYARLRAEGGAVAWLSVDPADEDPARFAAYLAHCLGRAVPGIGQSALALLESGAQPSLQPVLESLLVDLTQAARPISLFIDDLHLVTGQAPLEMLGGLLAHAPDQVVFVIGSRSKPRLNLQELQLRGKMIDITMADLRFSAGEAQELLHIFSDRDIDPVTVQRLCQHTEGWPAALQLASLSLRGNDAIEAMVEGFTGSDRQICDYLGEVVLARLPAELHDFLLQTSVLDRLCADLCRAVTGCRNSQAMLEDLEARNLFLIPLDSTREWYRYHHLFQDFLRQRLKSIDLDAPAALKARSAQWFRQHGLDEEAINDALAAGDYQHAACWIAESGEDLVQRRGAHVTLLNWMRRLPEPYLAKWPAIRIHRAWSLAFSLQFAEAERELETVEAYRHKLLKEGCKEAASEVAAIDCMVQLQRTILAALRDRAEESQRLSEAWLQSWPAADPFKRGAALAVLGFACKCRCDFERGWESLRMARLIFDESYGYYGTAWAIMIITVLLAKQGRHREAMDECARGLALITHQLGPHAHAVYMLSALMAAMHYERDELAEAEAHLRSGLSHVREQSTVDPLIAAYQTAARLAFHQGENARGDSLLVEGIALGERRHLPRLVASLQAELATAHLRRGEVAQAADVLRAGTRHWRMQMVPDHAAEETSPWGLVRARIDIANHEPERALIILHKLLSRAHRLGHRRKEVELLVLKTMAREQMGRQREALRALRDALAMAAPAGYLRVFLNEGESLRWLVKMLLETTVDDHGLAHDHLQRLAHAFRIEATGGGTDAAADPTDVLEPLTAKETQVLRLVATGRSNEEVAESMFVSQGTVKWHLHNVYAKLQVRNRTAALSRARGLRLLD